MPNSKIHIKRRKLNQWKKKYPIQEPIEVPRVFDWLFRKPKIREE